MASTENSTVPAGPGDLDSYVMTDQPTACPKCQRRTPYIDLPDGSQHHQCAHCSYAFLIWADFDGEEQCDHCREFADLTVLEANDGLCRSCVASGIAWSE